MEIISRMILAAAAGEAPAEVPIGALVALGVFLLLFVVFVVAWVRKRRRRLDEAEEALAERERERLREREVVPPPAEPVEPVPPPVEEEGEEEEEAEEEPPVFTLGEAASFDEGLARTQKEGFVARLGKLFRGKAVDASLVNDIEEVMFTSDIGVKTSQRLLEGMRTALSKKELADEQAVWTWLQKETRAILDQASDGDEAEAAPGDGPRVVMVVGVNGTGKTTSIGKLAARYKSEGRRILLAAGDTFRAAAVEQLEIWARRVEVDIHKGKEKADPASVVYDAIERAKKEGHDLVIVDTAGRLHTQVNLMEELKKVHRVIGKAREGAPHEVLLVLDATTGQNAIQQAQIFGESVPVTGITLTKLDGTAKGGVVIGICDQLHIPIRWVGVGERVQDLRRFDSGEFVAALYHGS